MKKLQLKTLNTTKMKTADELIQELFQIDVSFSNGYAKWSDYNHPTNSDFENPIFWIALYHSATDAVTLKYKLTPSDSNYYTHITVDCDGRRFEDVVFDFWRKK